ncbi:MAG: hypothetical protein KAR20_15335, partial [Candidatus Heimdallarchaeota archaeon]|nr:hypothetical protein [Candidatus Heimdallarchaeota archaeon]
EIKVRIEETKHKNHAYEIASTVCIDEIDEIVSIGGDGTINEIANALIDTNNLHCRIAVIPTGVGNFIARHVGATKNYRKALNVAINGITREIDVFEVRSISNAKRTFLGCLGVGFDSLIVKKIDGMRSGKPLTKLDYCLLCMKFAFYNNWEKLRISVDDVDIDKEFFWVEAVNTREYGGGFVFSPNADCQDGLLDVVAFEKQVNKKMLQYFIGLMFGTILKNKFIEFYRCEKLKVTSSSDTQVPVQVDGGLFESTPIEIEYTGKKVKFASKF